MRPDRTGHCVGIYFSQPPREKMMGMAAPCARQKGCFFFGFLEGEYRVCVCITVHSQGWDLIRLQKAAHKPPLLRPYNSGAPAPIGVLGPPTWLRRQVPSAICRLLGPQGMSLRTSITKTQDCSSVLLSALEHFELPEHRSNIPSRALWNCS